MHVLGIGCHPDDLECYCGGTLRKYVEQGAQVTMCHIANGDQGHVIIEPGPLGMIRTKEAENAGKIIGAKEVISLNVSDMQVNVSILSPDVRLGIVAVIAEILLGFLQQA